MAHLRFTDVQDRPTEFLDFTSLTLDEFQLLVPPFEAAFHAHVRAWRLDGKPRTARQFGVYKNCPLPTPEDRLEGVSKLLICYPLGVSERNRTTHVRASNDDDASAALPLLPRDRYCQAWSVA